MKLKTRLSNSKRYATSLMGLLFLFCLRVLGQVLVVFWQVRYLPPLKEWQSGILPYPMLLLSQMFIIGLFSKVCFDLWQERGYFAQSHGRLGTALLNFGRLYLVSMLLRYIIWMILSPEARWFGGCIPIVFHCALASFLLILGRYYHNRDYAEQSPAATDNEIRLIAIDKPSLAGTLNLTVEMLLPIAPPPPRDFRPTIQEVKIRRTFSA